MNPFTVRIRKCNGLWRAQILRHGAQHATYTSSFFDWLCWFVERDYGRSGWREREALIAQGLRRAAA